MDEGEEEGVVKAFTAHPHPTDRAGGKYKYSCTLRRRMFPEPGV